MKNKFKKALKFNFAVLLVFSMLLSGCTGKNNSKDTNEKKTNQAEEKGGSSTTKEITDMRGKKITIPKDPKRVVIIDKGWIAPVRSTRTTMMLSSISDTPCI